MPSYSEQPRWCSVVLAGKGKVPDRLPDQHPLVAPLLVEAAAKRETGRRSRLPGGTAPTGGSGGVGGSGGQAPGGGGTGGGSGGAGGGGGAAPAGRPGMALVSGGGLCKSANYTVWFAMGESPGGNGKTATSTNYLHIGGVIATTQP